MAGKRNDDKKYIMIVTSEDIRYNPNYPKGGGVQLGFFADHPWEGRFECCIDGDNFDELLIEAIKYDIEGLFYQLYENKSGGERISYGSVDYDRIEEEIAWYETEAE